jgi:multidrug/hemolysin transport system permease protein
MINFGIRNLKVFFKDKSSVFFSLLSVFIIIGLYALFLGDVWVSSFSEIEGVRFLMNSWIVAGLLTVTSVTTTMGAFGIMVEDKSSKINKDFIASPIKNSSIVAGYIISAIVIGIIMSIVALILSEIYIVLNGGELMGFTVLLKVLGLIVLATIVNSSIVLFFVSFFRSSNAFATASTVLGTMIGFLTGIYLPIGNLPSSVQLVIKCFPISHAAVLFRQVMMEVPLSRSFQGAPSEYLINFKEFMGVEFYFNETVVTPFTSIVILVVTAIVFYILSVMKLSRKQR